MIDASDPNDRADQLLAVAGRLIALVKAEAEAMSRRELKGAGADWEEKERLVHSWRLEVQRIRLDPSLIRSADPHGGQDWRPPRRTSKRSFMRTRLRSLRCGKSRRVS